jgi:hypothetical protein
MEQRFDYGFDGEPFDRLRAGHSTELSRSLSIVEPLSRTAHHPEPFENLTAPRRIEGEDRGAV